ncbi:MAG: hypothetical protein PHU25_20200 [Deltaproteobacteria bacterium]|nr:hypothetical protein [Deltaproteobacteria bacterium]
MQWFKMIALVFALVAPGCTNTEGPLCRHSDCHADTEDTSTGTAPLGPGDDCSGGGTCADGLACSGIDGTCVNEDAPGTGSAGDDCKASWECTFGLACSANGKCAETGDPGTAGAGEICATSTDCAFFLECLDGACQGFQPPWWPGVTCPEPAPDDEPLKVYFEVKQPTDFYAFPFPNNARLKNGRIDLTGHPNPGILVTALGNPVDDYFDVIQNDLGGFGTQAYVFFRFNHWPDSGTLHIGDTVSIINIDKASPDYGRAMGTAYKAASAAGKYICENWLAVGPTIGRPLDGGTTYAVVLTNGIRDKKGNPVEPDVEFSAMVRDAAPSDAALTSAWNAYAPFRDYLKAQSIDKNTIAAASVITTMKPQDRIPRVRQAVRARPAPTTAGIGVDQSGQAFDLTTGTVTIPQFQAGTRPFKTPADGGAIAYDGQGLPVFVEDQTVKFALSVPKGAAPAGGWPIVIYAHGTGGNERSFIGEGVADEMAGAQVAVIGIEQVQHGDRRGLPADQADLEVNSPERLFYNFLNPRAARDNVVQTAADHFQVVRLVESFQAVTGQPVTFDTARIFFFGHSQGSQGGFLFAAHEPLVKLAILSGAGGYLAESFVGKTRPVNVAAAVRIALADFEVDRFHPLLNLVQAAFEEVDPTNFAGTMFMDDWTASGYPHRSVFMSYGIGDTYTPEKTMLALARAMRVKKWPEIKDVLDGVDAISALPHTQTWGFGSGVWVTSVVVQYEPASGKDGHFVIFDNADAKKQVTEFVRTMVQTGVPTLVSP